MVPQSVSGERCKKINDWIVENKIKYLSKFVGKEMSAILENTRRSVGVSNSLFVYHAVTENFIHCEIRGGEGFPMGKTIKLRIKDILADRIKKGGEIEVSAEII